MPDVIIDGTRYTPATGPRVGVAISTHNRRDTYNHTLDQWRKHASGATIITIDDASTEPCPDAIRFNTQQGIAKTKNAGIAALMNLGCEHLFLTDDDCYPIKDGWQDLYTTSGEPHAMYLFKDVHPNGSKLPTPDTIYDDNHMYALRKPRGCLLYLQRAVVERIGGMRTDFGVWGHEHVEYSLRAYHAGLTSHPFQDACGSHEFIYSMDEHFNENGITRSVPLDERRDQQRRNDELINQYIGTDDFVEYRDLPDYAITALLTKHPDPQRGNTKLAADPTLVGKWLASLQNCTPIVLHDELDVDQPPYIKVPTSQQNPYLQRWHIYHRYLRDHPARWVWLTDGTDVEMLHSPWEHMQPGCLYVGYEPNVTRSPWMYKNHMMYQPWLNDNPNLTLLNAGIVGGDHTTVLDFCHAMMREITWNRAGDTGLGDMAAFNYICHSPQWRDHIEYGPQWVTLFKHDETNDYSCWKHK